MIHRFFGHSPGLLALCLLAAVAHAATPPHYDEVFEARGPNARIRPHYAQAYAIYRGLTEGQKERFLRATRRDFEGDNALDPLPRLLLESEVAFLRRGVEQRAKALMALLTDHYSGKKTYRDGVLPEDVVTRVIARHGDAPWEGILDPSRIAFPYGPDIVRDPRGVWRVVEDNIGWLGGPGDLAHARRILLDRLPAYGMRIPIRDRPEQFFVDLIDFARARATPAGGAIALFTPLPFSDSEDKRLQRLFTDAGVYTVNSHTHEQLVVTPRGVFVETKGTAGSRIRKRVGFVFLNGEHHQIDWGHPAIAARLEVEEQARRGPPPIPGLLDAIVTGKVASNYSPGVDFADDKELYIYVEDLIRFYLHEEPLLRNIPSGRFPHPALDRSDRHVAGIAKIFSNLAEYVIKCPAGRGGDSVWVGPRLGSREARWLKRQVEEDPAGFLWQRYTPLSIMDDLIVDLRIVASVATAGIVVAETPWGRALPRKGNGKVNLSGQGRETAVIVVRDRPGACSRRLAAR